MPDFRHRALEIRLTDGIYAPSGNRRQVPGGGIQQENAMERKARKLGIRPLHDRVVIRRQEPERTSTGGIIIPDTATEEPVRGEVVAVGSGKILERGDVRPLDVRVGDEVLFGRHSGTEIKVDDEGLLVVRENDVMAVLEG